tara:strand:+ start:326 stop:595 length:270 start_codon:yes stop_codon:yes gene_type:complete
LKVNNNNSRPWKLEGTFGSYEEASEAKAMFLENNSKMQAKIRHRHSKSKFSLKSRLSAEFVEEKTKNGKSKRRNRKTSEGGELNAPATV